MSSSGSRQWAINNANGGFDGTIEIQDGQVTARVTNATGSASSTLIFNPISNANGVGLTGGTVTGANVTLASQLQFAKTASGNSQFITTSGGSTLTLSGNFSETGSGTSGYIGVGRGNNILSNIGGGFRTGTDAGVATIALNGTGTLSNKIGIVNSTTATSVLSLGNTTGTQTFSGIVSGNGSLVRNGLGGTTILSNANTYTGGTIVSAGILVANNSSGSATGSSSVSVSTGATLSGSGAISGATTIAGGTGRLAANAQASGTALDFGSTLALGSNSIFDWTLNAQAADPGATTSNFGSYSQVAVGGAVSGTSVFNIILGSGSFSDAFWTTSKTWTNVLSGSGLTNLAGVFPTFSGANVTSSGLASNGGQFTFNGTNLDYTFSAIPEPSSVLAGLLLATGLMRRRRA